MFSLEIASPEDTREMLIAELWEQGSSGIVEVNAEQVRAFFDDDRAMDAMLARYPGAVARVEDSRDWVQSARELLQPMEVGRRFFLVPEWRDDATPPGRFRITVNPGMAFGTGVHETTRLCLEALEEFRLPGLTVLDVGTGSGILAKAARMLAPGQVFACDVDPVAVEIAGEGFVGSVDAVASTSVDLVVANISPEAIVQLGPEFRRVLRGPGVLLASGFEVHEVDAVRGALGDVAEVRHKGNWALIVSYGSLRRR